MHPPPPEMPTDGPIPPLTHAEIARGLDLCLLTHLCILTQLQMPEMESEIAEMQALINRIRDNPI